MGGGEKWESRVCGKMRSSKGELAAPERKGQKLKSSQCRPGLPDVSLRSRRSGHLVRRRGILGWVLEKEHSFEIASMGNKIWSKLELNKRFARNANQPG